MRILVHYAYIPQPRSAMPHFQGTGIIPIVSSALSYCKPGILEDLTDDMKEIGIAKNK